MRKARGTMFDISQGLFLLSVNQYLKIIFEGPAIQIAFMLT